MLTEPHHQQLLGKSPVRRSGGSVMDRGKYILFFEGSWRDRYVLDYSV